MSHPVALEDLEDDLSDLHEDQDRLWWGGFADEFDYEEYR